MTSAVNRTLYLGLFFAGISPFFINGALNPVISPRPGLYWAFEFFSWIVLPALVFGVAVRRGGLRFYEIGLHSQVRGHRRIALLVMLCVLAGPFYLFVYSELYQFFRNAFPGQALFTYQSVVPESGLLRTLVAIYMGLTAGIVEEFYFRGLFFKISQFFPSPLLVYVLGSSILFALVHWEGGLSNVAATFVLGVISSFVFIVVRNLWPLIVGHIYTDFMWYV